MLYNEQSVDLYTLFFLVKLETTHEVKVKLTCTLNSITYKKRKI